MVSVSRNRRTGHNIVGGDTTENRKRRRREREEERAKDLASDPRNALKDYGRILPAIKEDE